MGIADKVFRLIVATGLFFSFSVPIPALCSELVGVVPFTNQREDLPDNWLGFYLQARVQSYLTGRCDCDFHTLNTLQLWQYHKNTRTPISVGNTILINGSYQLVLDQGIVEITVIRFSPVSQEKTFEFSFQKDELETKIDQLSASIVQWIEPGNRTNKPFKYPNHRDPNVIEAFRLRETLFTSQAIPEIGTILRLENLIPPDAPADFWGDIAESMIILSVELTEQEKKSVLARTERLLRSAAMIHLRDARIHALLAETFYLSGKERSWIEKTANESRNINKSNELALLMLALSSDGTEESAAALVKAINDINPWIWPDDVQKDKVLFQKGIFNAELLSLSELVK